MPQPGLHASSSRIQSQPKPRWPAITWISSPRSEPSSAEHLDAPRLRILGINPWIYDFAAYNFWSRPAGLLTCLQLMNRAGASVALFDCLDPMWSDMPWPKSNPWGTGPYPKLRVPKPDCLRSIPRHYSRYGLPLEAVENAFLRLQSRPDLIFITSIMTYWYPGAEQAIDMAKKIFPKVPVVLGGIYASLCREHAQVNSKADLVISGPLERPNNWKQIWNLLGQEVPPIPGPLPAGPALDSYPDPEFSILLGSRGCPFHCTYCASDLLSPGFEQRSFEEVWGDIQGEIKRGVRDFAFYDDALLVQPETWLQPLLKHLAQQGYGVRLHTPNALHARWLSPAICDLLYKAGLTTVRLGLETADFSNRRDQKLTQQEWDQGVSNLFAAGFKAEQIGAYILFGLPGQESEELIQAIRFVQDAQIRPHLAQYTPIPGSSLFESARAVSPYPIEEEPLFQNNSIWSCKPGGFSWEEQTFWKKIERGGE